MKPRSAPAGASLAVSLTRGGHSFGSDLACPLLAMHFCHRNEPHGIDPCFVAVEAACEAAQRSTSTERNSVRLGWDEATDFCEAAVEVFLVSSRPVQPKGTKPGAVLIYAVAAKNELDAIAAVELAIPPGFDGVTCLDPAPGTVAARLDLEVGRLVIIDPIE